MLVDQHGMPGDVAGVEVGDSQVEQYVEDVSQVEDGEVETVFIDPHGVLHPCLDAQNPERFDEQVEQQYPKQAGEEFLLHGVGGEGF